MEQAVSNSLCGLSLAKAAIAIGALHTVIYGTLFFYLTVWIYADWIIVFHVPSSLMSILEAAIADGLSSTDALLCSVCGVCLSLGAWKGEPGLVLTWMVQQIMQISSSLLTLFYFSIASYLKVPFMDLFLEICTNGFQAYFFVIVYSLYKELRKGNLQEDNDPLVNS